MNRHLFIVVSLGLAMVSVGCGDGGGGTSPGSSDAIPSALADLEGTAEDAYDQALVGNFTGVADDATAMDSAWQTFRPEAKSAGSPASILSAMDTAIADLKAAAVAPTDADSLARKANAISDPMDELYGLYVTVVPPDVLALDYLGREVVLDARQGDFDGATHHVDTLESTFEAIRGDLVAGGGATEADDYDASIAAMRADIAATDGAQLETDANVELELVDVMEGVFEGR